MNYTNLNIKYNATFFKYIIEQQNNVIKEKDNLKYSVLENGIYFKNTDLQNMSNDTNYFFFNEETKKDMYVPDFYEKSVFNIYFPRFSVDTYQRNVKYVLTLNIWISNTPVYLCSVLLDRNNAIANNCVKKFFDDNYYEHIQIQTVNPKELMYSDNWKKFRKYICGEQEDIFGLQKNDSEININATLTPIKYINDTWIKIDNFDSCQSVLNCAKNNDFAINLNFNNELGQPKFVCNISFNDFYNGNLIEYMLETYQIDLSDNYIMKYCFMIGDKDNPYKFETETFDTPVSYATFDADVLFDSWDDYLDGLYANVVLIFQKDGVDVLVFNSNKIFLTQEIFKYLLPHPIRHINLENIDMEIKNYNVVNVIENNIVSVERPMDYKSNIIKPVFFKVQNADSIKLHKGVTENICINLDAYKNKVDAFILKIGDMNFLEIGRINTGIIFKVINVQSEEGAGIYNILDNNGELVTTGNYVIE